MKERILIVDDDPKIRSLLTDILQEHHYVVAEAKTTEEGWEKVERFRPDLILLDVEVPLKGGLEFCREMKEKETTEGIPIIFLTVRDQQVDRVSALTLGGDDFIVKPFHPKELLIRIEVSLRRALRSQPVPTTLQSGTLHVDVDRRIVRIGGRELHLTPKELELLKFLYINRHKVLTEKAIFDNVWGAHCTSMLSTVYTHVERLRKKMGPHGRKIKTVPGTGFRFDERKGTR